MTGKQAVILGSNSDIALEISKRLWIDGYTVIGLNRQGCDLSNIASVEIAISDLKTAGLCWDLFISCAGTVNPIGPFFDLDFDAWDESIIINALNQLRFLHGIWPLRNKSKIVDVMLMAGGGTNSAFTNYSAYALSKIMLVKMVELLDDEEKSANFFSIGPGFVKTKIHNDTLKAGDAASKNYQKTLDLMKTEGTSYDDIYDHLKWCMEGGRKVSGGRNFSTVHDPWRKLYGQSLSVHSSLYPENYRLRRRGFVR